ncbi:ScbR family autoregulator-binding transcription factor [Embleya scabrispora]|uniref:ScbR family autoregulator-binding transcription factor n=1 Tax=Embleya scabrispora TaxID=159449 RepID=UPI00037F284F|nr:ScbR family autoregulator-binding transcription factor [Embleya scabrispora]MYS86235.1 TetR family transcriptional regulator [Streptomyces sp. SID5474]
MQARAGTTRQSLLETAARLFHERGFAGTSISDIGNASGLTSGAIYFHFSNKDALARAVVEAHFATWPELIERQSPADAPALEGLVRLSFAVARAYRDDPVVRGGARLWGERYAIDAILPTPFVGWIATARALLDRAREKGELAKRVDPAAAARSIIHAFFGMHTVSDALSGRADIEDDLTDLWHLLLPALLADPELTEDTLARAAAGATGDIDGEAVPRVRVDAE